ncbi:type II secretion system F family protein [Isoalcanivorax indicus]|uniref:type II secretion system F family protein n=1 Tax=Isoalcanivorax indicus TaxID=2202653 RepID=UPI000DBAD329|nr:type II secretion system F family protein [Isoalcanivorax indicus]
MSEVWLWLAVLSALGAFWAAVWLAPAWARRDRISRRMEHRYHGVSGSEVDEPQGWLLRFAERALGTGVLASDFREVDEALSRTALSRERIVLTYSLACWVLPLALGLAGLLIYGPLGGLAGLALTFVLARRIIRKRGEQAEAQMNREAVALCQLMRMFLETGMTLERAFRTLAQQAGPLMPVLIRHIDTFNRRIDAGMDRSRALAELGRNRNVPVLYDLTIILRQTGVLGTGAGEAINALIQRANEIERARLQEAASKVSAKMSAVMVLCMLPALMILIAGPGLVSFSELLR